MEIRLHRKSMAVLTAAVLLGTAALTATSAIGSISAVTEDATEEPAAVQVEATTEAATEEMVSEPTEAAEEGYDVTSWWKADLSEYSENLSTVSYETVEIPEETTEAEVISADMGSDYEVIEIVSPSEPTPSDSSSSESTDTSASDSSSEENVSEPVERVETETAAPAGSFTFTTYGYGHGVGMSQNGANHYASYSGWDYTQILQHYYPGTSIVNTGNGDGTISAGGISGSVLDIVSMVTYREVGSSMANEAIKAQAVAVYTYIMYHGGNASDLRPKSNPPQNVVDAVNSVLGEAIYYNGSYALAMFSASSGGYSASCADVFVEDIPYLRSVYCDYDASYDPHYGTVEVISAEQVRSELESCLGITLSDNPENWISITEGAGGYVAYVTIDGQVSVKGNKFRGYLGLKSPNFTVSYN